MRRSAATQHVASPWPASPDMYGSTTLSAAAVAAAASNALPPCASRFAPACAASGCAAATTPRVEAIVGRRPCILLFPRLGAALFGGAFDVGTDRLRREDKEQRREHGRKGRDHERIADRLRAIRSLEDIVEISDRERADPLAEAGRGQQHGRGGERAHRGLRDRLR